MSKITFLLLALLVLFTNTVSAQSGNDCATQLRILALEIESLPDSFIENTCSTSEGLWGLEGEVRTYDTMYYDFARVTVAKITERSKKKPLPGKGRLVTTQIGVQLGDKDSELSLIWAWDYATGTTEWYNSHPHIYEIDAADTCKVMQILGLTLQYIYQANTYPREAIAHLAAKVLEIPTDELKALTTEDASGNFRYKELLVMKETGVVVIPVTVLVKKNGSLCPSTALLVFSKAKGNYVWANLDLESNYVFTNEETKKFATYQALRALTDFWWKYAQFLAKD